MSAHTSSPEAPVASHRAASDDEMVAAGQPGMVGDVASAYSLQSDDTEDMEQRWTFDQVCCKV